MALVFQPTLLFAVVTSLGSNFIKPLMTATLPFMAAIWPQVTPLYNVLKSLVNNNTIYIFT